MKYYIIILASILVIICSAQAVPAIPGHIVINEIKLGPTCNNGSNNTYIELYNNGAGFQNIRGWVILNKSREISIILPDWNFPNNTYLMIYFGSGINENDFSDGSGSFYTGKTIKSFNRMNDEWALYNGTPSGSAIVDFVAWGARGPYSGDMSYNYAVMAGIWDRGDYFNTSQQPVSDIGRDKDSTDTNRPDNWFENGGINADGPTPGKDNDAFNIYDQSIMGTIVNTNGVPLKGARISINGSTIEAYSDNNGSYKITNAPVGVQTLVVSKEGFVSTSNVAEVFYNRYTYSNFILTPLGNSTSIGPKGGVVYGKDGTIITIPPGALNRTANITITTIPPASLPISEQELNGMSHLKLTGLSLGPDKLTFSLPITVNFPFSYLTNDTNNIFNFSAGDTLQVALFDPTTLTWHNYVNATINTDKKSATIHITHFSLTTTYIGNYKFDTIMTYQSYPPLKYLTQCLCKEGEASGTRTCQEGQYTNQISTKVSVTSSLSAGIKDVVTASIGVTEGKEITETWKSPAFESANCYDKEIYGQWKGQHYVVGVSAQGLFSSKWVYLGDVIIDEPTGPEYTVKQKDKFKKECDKCCRECTPTETKSQTDLIPPKEPCELSYPGDNCFLSGESTSENLQDIPGNPVETWLDACKKQIKIHHNVDGSISTTADVYCYCKTTGESEYDGSVSCDKAYHGSYDETKILDYSAGICP
jgi:hypothetical protein